jgi:hypothetical protein
MYCPSCQSSNQAEFTTEMIIHFSGIKNIDKPGVWVFPKVSVCLDCGSSRFATPKTELGLLARGTATSAASTRRESVAAVAPAPRIDLAGCW